MLLFSYFSKKAQAAHEKRNKKIRRPEDDAFYSEARRLEAARKSSSDRQALLDELAHWRQRCVELQHRDVRHESFLHKVTKYAGASSTAVLPFTGWLWSTVLPEFLSGRVWLSGPKEGRSVPRMRPSFRI